MKKIASICLFILCGLHVVAQFGSPQRFANYSRYVHGMAVFDVNSDGTQDFVFGCKVGNALVWSANTGSEDFDQIFPMTTSGIGSNDAMDNGDIDNDGDIDIVIAGGISGSSVACYKNNGDGTFAAPQPVGGYLDNPRCIFLADMDNNGFKDILIADEWNNEVLWYPNSGGVFGSKNTISSSASYVESVYAKDLDNDGDIDAIAAVWGATDLVWYENLGTGVFSSAQIINASADYPNCIYSADLNNDGWNDVLGTNYSGDIMWHQNLGSGNFGAVQYISTLIYGAESICVSDFDLDGDQDVVSAGAETSKLNYHENLGAGSFAPGVIIYSSADVVGDPFVSSADVDNDGDHDLLTALSGGPGNIWYENQGAGVFEKRYGILPNEVYQPRDVCTADLDLDGDLDVISASMGDDKIACYENLGDDFFSLQVDIDTSCQQALSVMPVDLDNDGDPDPVYLSQADSTIYWSENLGNFAFGLSQIIADNLWTLGSMRHGDLNADGLEDIVFQTYTGGSLITQWCENLGGSFSAPQQIFSNPFSSSALGCQDLTGDGAAEIVITVAGEVSILINQGNAIFNSPVLLSTLSAQEIIFRDFDGDGLEDILGAHNSSGMYFFWVKNAGAGVFEPSETLITGSSTLDQYEVIDYDVDGDFDLLYTVSANLFLRENLGNESFGPEIVVNPSLSQCNEIHVADLNGDGDDEILVTAEVNHKLVWLENMMLYNSQVSGRVFVDLNENEIFDSGEVGVYLANITSYPTSDFTYTNSAGIYFMNLTDSLGVYEIALSNISSNWSLTTDSASYTIPITTTFTPLDSLDFGIYPAVLADSVSIELTGAFPSCGMNRNYWVQVFNLGTTMPSGILHLALDDELILVSSLVTPDSVNGQHIYWSLDSLNYFDDILHNLVVHMPSFTSMGNPIETIAEVMVTDNAGNIVFSDSDTLVQFITCAYDPNDKTAEPPGSGPEGFIPMDTEALEYTVRFQNTGTDTVHTVIIEDLLDNALDWTSFQHLGSSHDMEVSVDYQLGKITFTFADIGLPDSNTNEAMSHGFVKYKISLLPNLPIYTEINNYASISFDLNPPILTNTKIHTLFDCEIVLDGITVPSLVCEDEIVTASVPSAGTAATYQWEIVGVDTIIGSDLVWHADTSGLMTVLVSATNEMCTHTNSFPLTVIAKLPLTNYATAVICDGDSLLVFGTYKSVEGIYLDTLQSQFGCDSILSQSLSVANHFQSTLPEINICNGDSALIFGIWQNLEMVYVDSFQTVNGCDSLIFQELDLFIPTAINLTAGPGPYCDHETSVQLFGTPTTGGLYSGPGVTANIFNPSIAGIGDHYVYYIRTDVNGCERMDSLLMQVIDCLGVEENNPYNISIYPNPFSDFTTISFGDEPNSTYYIKIYDLLGQLVYSNENLAGLKIEIHRNFLQSGTYLLTVYDARTNNICHNQRIIIL